MATTVRFSKLVEKAGDPEVYLALSDPTADGAFKRAVRDNRVLSLKQEPTGTKKDFGTVGYVAERFVTYLLFPKPLTEFKGRRVIGIDYDALRQADVAHPSSGTKIPKRAAKPKPAVKAQPSPSRYKAAVRLVAFEELEVVVEAMNVKEARATAIEKAKSRSSLNSQKVEAKLLRLNKETAASN